MGEMTEQSDTQLLRDYSQRGHEAAFREIVLRHTDFVYSAALRQVESSAVARDVAQSVFTDLARKARPLAEKMAAGGSLAGWLYRSTRFAALNQLRDDRRRLAHERQAMEQLITNSEAAPDWERVRPVLDEAMADLSEEDREALLLRYFKNQDLRAVGLALGVSDDTAQKRVSRAVERLREFFSKRNVTIGAGGLSVLISANAVQSAPVGLAATISAAALLAGTAIHTSTAIAATKAIAMTTLQKTLVTATVAILAGAGIYEAHQAVQLCEQNQTLRQQQAPLGSQIQQLHSERDDATNRMAGLLAENAQLKSSSNEDELLKLRGEVTQLRADSEQLAQLKTASIRQEPLPTDAAANILLDRVARLRQRLDQLPNESIPELQFLTLENWLHAAELSDLKADDDFLKAFSDLRSSAKYTLGKMMRLALFRYARSNEGMLPTNILELQSYFDPPASASVLRRYELLNYGNIQYTINSDGTLSAPATMISQVTRGEKPLILEKAPVDKKFDTRLEVGMGVSGAFDLKYYSYTNGIPP